VKLGDFFSKKEKKYLLLPKGLVIGTVIRAFVDFTNPPKEKRFIVVGFYDDKVNLAVVLVNTDVNTLVNFNQLLQSHHIKLESKGREYLTHDSYVDCTELHKMEIQPIEDSINAKPEICIGSLNKEDLDLIMKKLIDSDFIKGKYKKKCGFFDYKFTS